MIVGSRQQPDTIVDSPWFLSEQSSATFHLHLDLDQVSRRGQQLSGTSGQETAYRRLPNTYRHTSVQLSGTSGQETAYRCLPNTDTHI